MAISRLSASTSDSAAGEFGAYDVALGFGGVGDGQQHGALALVVVVENVGADHDADKREREGNQEVGDHCPASWLWMALMVFHCIAPPVRR